MINEALTIKNIILEIIQKNKFESSSLPITNTFILFNQPRKLDDSNLCELRDFKINKSCKRFFILFNHSSNFKIFQDDKDCEEETETNETVEIEIDQIGTWYQAKAFVRGLNDIPSSIWSN